MCSQFVLLPSSASLKAIFRASSAPADLVTAPTAKPQSNVFIVRSDGLGRSLSLARWGLVPSWEVNEAIGRRLTKGRWETAARRSLLAKAFCHRRCLIPVSGFCEPDPASDGSRSWYFTAPDARPLAIAGLWEWWESESQLSEMLETCLPLTTAARGIDVAVHRIPLILAADAWEDWLSPTATDAADIERLIRAQTPVVLIARPVAIAAQEVKATVPDCRMSQRRANSPICVVGARNRRIP